jgi:hypothetical protein
MHKNNYKDKQSGNYNHISSWHKLCNFANGKNLVVTLFMMKINTNTHAEILIKTEKTTHK